MKTLINKMYRSLLILYLIQVSISAQTFLDPDNYTSLGSFNSTGNVSINMSTGQMSGGASFTGVSSGGVLVFTFASFTLNSGHTISFTNVSDLDKPFALLSHGDMTISGTINANASGQTAGPSGGFGGEGGTSISGSGQVGSGPGAGTGTDGGAGAGFGGTGGDAYYTATGGPTYNANFTSGITGGSGGTGSDYGGTIPSPSIIDGGGGGGGIELGSKGTLTINGTASITAIGGDGNDSDDAGRDGGGGGSGGGIFIHSFNVTLQNGCLLNVSGGDGGSNPGSGAGSSGAGGGGGRVYIAAHTSGTLTNNGAAITISGGDAGTDAGGGQVGANGSSGTSTITQVNNSALPVELLSFTVNEENGSAILKWETATEVNNYGFDIQKQVSSIENQDWEKIGFVQGHGTTNSPKLYSFIDSELPDASEVSYRLKQIDNDGTSTYSKVVTVNLGTITNIEDQTKKFDFTLGQNYPNPFNPSTKIRYTVPNTENKSISNGSLTKLTVYNSLGEKVAVLVNESKQPGEYEVDFNAKNLSSGLYLYEITIGEQYKGGKKMLLLR